MENDDIIKKILLDFVKETPEGWFHNSITLKEIKHYIDKFMFDHCLYEKDD